MEIWAFFLALGLIARATRLATADTITDPLRNWLAGPRPEDDAPPLTSWARVRVWIAYWAMCNWCIGLVIAIAGAASFHYWGHTTAWRIAALGATTNLIYATVSSLFHKGDMLIGHLINLGNAYVTRSGARPGGR